MSQDRRIHYRVTPTIERDVHVFAITASGTTHQVGLIDISAGGIAFGLTHADPLTAEVGDVLTLRFETGRLQKSLEIQAKLCRQESAESNIIYGVAFEAWANERHGLAPQLRSLFNEREAVRVEPEDDDELDVSIQVAGHSTLDAGFLRDISVLGVGIWLADENQFSVTENDALTVGIQLNPDEENLEIQVRVCHTQHIGDRVRIGAEIVDGNNRTARAQKKRIMDYVMKRQIQVARIDAERRRAMQEHYPAR